MRRLIPLAIVSVGVLSLAAVAVATQTQTLTAKVTPAKASTATKVRGVSLDITTATSESTGAKPSPATRAVLRFHSGFKFYGRAFPTCKKANLDANLPEKCAKAVVGTGDAKSDARPIIAAPLVSTLTAYNGVRKNGKDTLLLYLKSSVGQPVTLVGVIKNEAKGSYGTALDVTVPPLKVLGVSVVLTTVHVKTSNIVGTMKVDGVSVKVPYVGAPRSCRSSWKFGGEFTYESGLKTVASDRVKCSK